MILYVQSRANIVINLEFGIAFYSNFNNFNNFPPVYYWLFSIINPSMLTYLPVLLCNVGYTYMAPHINSYMLKARNATMMPPCFPT